MKAIKIKDLCFSYRNDTPILKNINLEFEAGKYYAILGHNGSGKSTLAKLINGLLTAKSGQIEIFDLPLNEKNIYQIRKNIGMVFQNPDNQFIGSTVRDDIAFGLENNQVPQHLMDGIINECAQKVNMENFLDKEPTQLSGGQKQRVAIAGILAMNPKIIIFDEATSMLDPKGRNEVNSAISNMRKINPDLTIIFITHDVDLATSCDQIVILKEGEVYAFGQPKTIFKDIQGLKSAHLDLPFLIKFDQELKENGINIKFDDMEGAIEQLCKLKLNN